MLCVAVVVAVVESVEDAVAVERAEGVAVWTASDLEPLDDADPLVVGAVEPSFAHDCCLRRKGEDIERSGVEDVV